MATKPEEALSALEVALRQALEAAPRGQVLRRVAAEVQLTDVAWEGALQHGGVAQKVSVSLPAELIETVRAHTGAGGFSRYVTEAVRKRVQHDLLGELVDELEAEYGPVPDEIRAQTRETWPDYEPD